MRLQNIREPLRTLFEFCADPSWLITAAVCLGILFSLPGCAPAHLVSQTGPAVDAPGGYTTYCLTHPERVECGGRE